MDEDRTAFVGKPLQIVVPCAGIAPGSPVTVKVFEPRCLGGDPIETLTAKVDQEGGSAAVEWTYDHAKHKDKVAQARFVFLVEGAGRTSISPPIQFLEKLEVTIKDEHGQPAAERLVTLHPDRGETIPAATNAEGKLSLAVPPGDYHFELHGAAPPELERPPLDVPPEDAAVAAGGAAAAPAALAAATAASGLAESEEEEPFDEDAALAQGEKKPGAKGAHFVAARLVEPDGKPSAGVKVFLVLADGSKREATTSDQGDVRWEGVPDGAVSLELEGDEYVPDVEPEPAPATETPDGAAKKEPETVEDGDDYAGRDRSKYPDLERRGLA